MSWRIAKQQFIELFSGGISYLKRKSAALGGSTLLMLFFNARGHSLFFVAAEEDQQCRHQICSGHKA